jgi:hypothetical protein
MREDFELIRDLWPLYRFTLADKTGIISHKKNGKSPFCSGFAVFVKEYVIQNCIYISYLK